MARSPVRKLAFAWFGLVAACSGTPDPRTPAGALGYAARAIEARDARMLFQVVDSRSRHAMISIVSDRRKAAELVRRSYPQDTQAGALATLGDAAEVTDAPALFARRCDAACMDAFASRIAAPERTETHGAEVEVHTVRGTTVTLHRSREGDWYGLVWETDALFRERDRANRDLHAIEENAAVYDRRRALESAPSP